MPGQGSRLTPEQRVAQADACALAGDHAAAAALYRGLIRDFPRIAALHFNFGNALKGQGNLEGAARAYGQAIALDPGLAEAHFNLANTARDLGHAAEALRGYQAVLERDGAHGGALVNLGNLLAGLGRPAEARRLLVRAAVAAPGSGPAIAGLGAMEKDAGDGPAAARWLRRAIALQPADAASWNNLGEVERAQGRFAEADRHVAAALTLDPGNAGLLTNLGRVKMDRDDAALSVRLHDRALHVAPGLAKARWNKGLAALCLGDLETGFALYENRFDAQATSPRALDCPRWDGAPLAGRRLLIWGEQGVADEILWSGCIPDALRLGDCIVECEPRLVGLFQRSFPDALVRASAPGMPSGADCHVPMGSLPRHFRRRLEDFPSGAVLRPDPARAALWRDRLAALGPGRKIGLSWRSRRGRGGNVAWYYTSLPEWEPLLRIPGLRVLSLQYDDDPAERASVAGGPDMVPWPDLDLLNDFEGLAAFMTALDGVASMANTVASLAGALGVPTWQLTAAGVWDLLGTRRHPWYDSVTVLQRRLEEPDWSAQIAEVARLAAHPPGSG